MTNEGREVHELRNFKIYEGPLKVEIPNMGVITEVRDKTIFKSGKIRKTRKSFRKGGKDAAKDRGKP